VNVREIFEGYCLKKI